LGKEFTRIAQANSAFYRLWMENEYQLRLGVKSYSALVGLASNMWGCQWRHKHHIR